MNYPDKDIVIETLLYAARKAAVEADVDHPEDIACMMLTAIEVSWPMIDYLNKNGHLK